MKKISLILSVVALVLGMSQCRKPVFVEPITPVILGGTTTETITFGTGDGSKVLFPDNATPQWEKEDKIVVYAYAGAWTRCGELALETGVGSDEATFKGSVDAPSGYTKVKFFHYGSAVVFDQSDNSYTANLNDQTGGISSVVIMKTEEIDKSPDGQYNGTLAPAMAALDINVLAWESGAVSMEKASTSKTTEIMNTVVKVDDGGNITTEQGTGVISYNANSHLILLAPTEATVENVKEFTLKRDNQEAKIRYDEMLVKEARQLTNTKVQYFDYNKELGGADYEDCFVQTTYDGSEIHVQIEPKGEEADVIQPFLPVPVVWNTTTYMEYDNIQEAIDEIADGQTLQLLSGVIINKPICTGAKNVTLDLYGYSITPDLVLKGTEAGDKDALIIVDRGGTLTITGNGSLNSAANVDLEAAEMVNSAIKMIGSNGGSSGATAKLVIDGCSITGYKYGISGNSENCGINSTDIEIKAGSSVRAAADNGNVGIFHPQNGTLKVNGGTVEGYSSGIEMRSGKLVMTAGTVKSTATTYSCGSSYNGNTTTGAGIAVATLSGNDVLDVNISGGEVEGYYALNVANPENNSMLPVPAVTVSGGKFKGINTSVNFGVNTNDYNKGILIGGMYNTDPTDYVAAGYEKASNSEEGYPYTVIEKPYDPYVAYIGDHGYMTLEEAFADANAAETPTTIRMVKDYKLIPGNAGVSVNYGKTITFDLAGMVVGNRVNTNGHSQVIKNNGTLIIKDSKGCGVLRNGVEPGTTPGEWWPTQQYNYVTNVITNCGNLTIESGKLEQTSNGTICYCVDNQSTSYLPTLNITGGEFYSCQIAIRMFCNSTTIDNVVNVSGGEIYGEANAIWMQLPGSGDFHQKGTLNVTGGRLIGSKAFYLQSGANNAQGVYVPSGFNNANCNFGGDAIFDGQVMVYGGNINISGGVYNGIFQCGRVTAFPGADIDISGGTFTGSYVYVWAGDLEITGGNFEQMIYIQHYYESITTEISGGVFEYDISSYGGYVPNPDKFIIGGTYYYWQYTSGTPLDWRSYVKDNYAPVQNESGTYTVVYTGGSKGATPSVNISPKAKPSPKAQPSPDVEPQYPVFVK